MNANSPKVPPRLSRQAAELLGQLISRADANGIVGVTRTELAKMLKVSVPTIARALRELVEAGELELEVPGGDGVAPADTGSPDYPAKRFHNPPAMGEVRRKNLVMAN